MAHDHSLHDHSLVKKKVRCFAPPKQPSRTPWGPSHGLVSARRGCRGPMNEDTIAYTAIKPRLRPGRHGALPAGMPPDSSDSTPAHKATPASPCSILALELDAPGTTSGLSGDACVAAVDASPRGPDFVSERLQRAKSSNMLRRISESGDDMSRRVTADAGGTTRRQEHEQNLPQLAV